MLRNLFSKGSVIYAAYDQFERIISVILLITISTIIVYATGLMMITLAGDFHAGLHFAEQGALKDTKAYPSASGDPICGGVAAPAGVERKANIVRSRDHHDRFSPLADRVPEPLSG